MMHLLKVGWLIPKISAALVTLLYFANVSMYSGSLKSILAPLQICCALSVGNPDEKPVWPAMTGRIYYITNDSVFALK